MLFNIKIIIMAVFFYSSGHEDCCTLSVWLSSVFVLPAKMEQYYGKLAKIIAALTVPSTRSFSHQFCS
jgi:hypothetical protein